MIARARLGLPRIVAWALEVGEVVNFDLFHKLRRREFLLWPGLELLYN